MNRQLNILLVIVAASCNGALAVVIKYAFSLGVSTEYLTLLSTFIGVLFFGIVYFKKYQLKMIFSKNFFFSMLTGVAIASSLLFYTTALNYLSASTAIVLQFQFVWISNILAAVINRQFPDKRKLLLLGIILLGTIMGSGAISTIETVNFQGMIAGVLCAICYSSYLLLNERINKSATWSYTSFGIMLGAGGTTLLTLMPQLYPKDGVSTALLFTFFLAALHSLLGYILPFILFAIAIPKIGLSLSSILCSMELPIAIGLSFFFLKETVTWVQVAGIVLILVSIIIDERIELIHQEKYIESS